MRLPERRTEMAYLHEHAQDKWSDRPNDCPYCLHHQIHTWKEHREALKRNDDCSYADEPEYNP